MSQQESSSRASALRVLQEAGASCRTKAAMDGFLASGDSLTCSTTSLAADSELDLIRLSGQHLSDREFQQLCLFPELESLCIEDTRVTRQAISYAATLTQLECLTCLSCDIDEDAFEGMQLPCTLICMDFTDSRIGDRHVAPLASSEIRSLSLAGTQVTDQAVRDLSMKLKFDELYLNGMNIGDRMRDVNVKDVRLLRLTGATFADDIRWIESAGNVRHLWLDYTNIRDEEISALAALTRLETLFLSGTSISDDGVANLCPLKSLSHISLDNTRIGDRVVQSLLSMDRLESAILCNTAVTAAGLMELMQHENLTAVFVSNTPAGAVLSNGVNPREFGGVRVWVSDLEGG